MSRSTLELIVLGAVCSVAVLMIPVEQTFAATKKVTEPAPVVVAKPIKQSSEQGQIPSIQRAKKSPVAVQAERQPEASQKQTKLAAIAAKPTNSKSPMPVARERTPEVIEKQVKPASAESKPVQADFTLTKSKNPRRMKVHKKEMPKAIVAPSIDLMYHGMLESPQRYDPRRNHRVGAGTPDPHNPELTRDHFQELDRNQDGSIDPVERVFGRLDMDRDLYDRRPR